MKKHVHILAASAVLAALATPKVAHAQTNDNCTSVDACLTASNSTSGGQGVYAETTATLGAVQGQDSSSGWGVFGTSSTGFGVVGQTSTSGVGVIGFGGQAAGSVSGTYGGYFLGGGTGNTGAYGQAYGGSGVYGKDTSSGYGVYGNSSTGDGVHGVSGGSSGSAVYGTNSSSGNGVYGTSSTGNGIYGYSTSGTKQSTSASAAIYAYNTNGGWAIYSNGPVDVYNSSYWYDYGVMGSQVCVGGFCASDERLKKNIKPISGALDQLLQLKGVTYEWKKPEEQGGQTGTQTGFVAQQVEKSFPNWVSQDKDGTKGIVLPPMQLAAMTVESIRQLNDRANKAEARADKADARADKAEAKNKDLDERIERLENMQGLGHRIAWWQNPSFFGLAFGGFIIGGAIFMGRRKRDEDKV
jgi:hypothetical protein